MPITRREFIVGLGAVTGIRFLAPITVRAGEAFGQTLPDVALATNRNRLVVIFLAGGNDGLNTVIPYDDVPGAPRYSVYRKVRPAMSYGYGPSQVLKLDRAGDDDSERMGLNPRLAVMHSLYKADRVSIVQGVDYPGHSYSHFTSTDFWQSGQPEQAPDSGWLGRHLDRNPPETGELRGLGVGVELPLVLQGEQKRGVEVKSVPETRFADSTKNAATRAPGDARHNAFANYSGAFDSAADPLRFFAGVQARGAVELVNALEQVKAPPQTQNRLANGLLTARALLEQPLGVECVFVSVGGYDTHTSQVAAHERLLGDLDQAIEAFLFGTLAGRPLGNGPIAAEVGARTMIMTSSEFGRRIGENGTGAVAGTDHGAAAPLFLIGPPAGSTQPGVRLEPGLHGAHPDMGTSALPKDNLARTTDLRDVYQAVLQHWLSDEGDVYRPPLSGLFTALS